MSVKFEINSWVWIIDEVDKYIPCKVLTSFYPGEPTVVLTEDGERRSVSARESAETQECGTQSLQQTSDLVTLSDLSEMTILHILRNRFKQNLIYTNISSILISVNPFQLLPIYTPEVLELYRSNNNVSNNNNNNNNKAPHVFAIANNAYNCMLSDSCNQSVIISGESGAGKSEATKLILQFLADVSQRATLQSYYNRNNNSDHDNNSDNNNNNNNNELKRETALEQQILAANPILEAFGNAKTLRNNNSSRFGKLITVKFDGNGGIVGGSIINYLLEKSRVVSQAKGERNYHIFYQLLSGIDEMYKNEPQFINELKLQDPELFTFTNQSGVVKVNGISDESDFEDVIKAMNILNFSNNEKMEVFRIVAGVLHMGNIKFNENDDKAYVLNNEIIQLAANLWNINPELIEKFLISKYIGTKDLILTNYTLQQAIDARDAMVKKVYAELFQLMVNRINNVLNHENSKNYKNFIGVLDIFGFESFQINSFEQLCINYCNEKLQFHFNEHIFTMEQSVYAIEGVKISNTSFIDNQPTLDLFELKTDGLYSMLDEEIALPKGSDETYLSKIFSKYADIKNNRIHPNLVKPKISKETHKQFGIVHYAGTVYYDVSHFLDKNKDQLNIDIMGVLKSSTSEIMKVMFAPFEDRNSILNNNNNNNNNLITPTRRSSIVNNIGNMKPKTLGAQFKIQLKELIDTLNATNPHFIRCLKPNDDKKGGLFTAQRMLDQLKYAGLLEVCRIRKLGYPKRLLFNEFFKKYRACDTTTKSYDYLSLINILKCNNILNDSNYAIGNTKIFLKTQQSYELDQLREIALTSRTIIIQRKIRSYLCILKYKNYKKIIKNLLNAILQRNSKELKLAIDLSFELPYNLTNKIVIKAKQLLIRVLDEIRINNLLDNAIKMRDLNMLQSSLKQANNAIPPYISELNSIAIELIINIEKENVLKFNLNNAIKQKDYNKLNELLIEAKLLNLECSETRQAITLKIRIELENNLLQELLIVLKTENINNINIIINRCIEEGLSQHTEIIKAKEIKLKLEEEQKSKEKLLREKAEAEEATLQLQKLAEKENLRQKMENDAALNKRKQMMSMAHTSMSQAVLKKDLDALNESIQYAITIGIDDENVQNAKIIQQKLIAKDEHAKNIKGQLRLLSLKEKVGILENDLISLNLLTNDISHLDEIDDELLSKAIHYLSLYKRQAEINKELNSVLHSHDINIITEILNNAEDLELDNDIVTAVKEKLQNIQDKNNISTKSKRNSITTILNDENINNNNNNNRNSISMIPITKIQISNIDIEILRKKRNDLANNARYSYKNYPLFRSVDNFARSAIFNKKTVKDSFFIFTIDDLPKSLTLMKYTEHNTHSLQVFKDIIGYMGDKIVQYPAMLAKDLLQKGYDNIELRPEIYLQIIKQLNGNPRAESIAKGWQLMCMCTSTFPPGEVFESYLIHYITEKRNKSKGAVVEYAKYCLRSLDTILSSSDNIGFVPSITEIEAYRDRPPILASFELINGVSIVEDIPIPPDQNCSRILEMCSGWLNIHDKRMNRFGIFVYDLGENNNNNNNNTIDKDTLLYENLPRTPRPLRNEEYLGDIIVQKARQRRSFKFIVKKKLFIPLEDNEPSQDVNYDQLIYQQAEHDMLYDGTLLVCHEESAIDFAAVSLVLAYGEETPIDIDNLLEVGLLDYLPPNYRTLKSEIEWGNLILPVLQDLKTICNDISGLQKEFITRARADLCLFYGTHWFFVYKKNIMDVTENNIEDINNNNNNIIINSLNFNILNKLPLDLLLGYDYNGLHICNLAREILITFKYEDINRWGGSPTHFNIILTDASSNNNKSIEFTVTTAQAQDMAAILLDYINIKVQGL